MEDTGDQFLTLVFQFVVHHGFSILKVKFILSRRWHAPTHSGSERTVYRFAESLTTSEPDTSEHDQGATRGDTRTWSF